MIHHLIDTVWMMDALFCFWWGFPKIALIHLDVTKDLVYIGDSFISLGILDLFWCVQAER